MTDHSKRVTMANGLDEKRLRKQWEEIDKLNERLHGITCSRASRSISWSAAAWTSATTCSRTPIGSTPASITGRTQPREQITKRVIDALKNPYVCAIAHPTGRLLNERKSYEIDLSAVIHVAREEGKALELNASSKRLDLDDVACAEAKSQGVLIVISTDAHRPRVSPPCATASCRPAAAA